MWDFYNDMGVLRPLNYVSDNNMQRLSVSESISKRWTTVKKRWLEGRLLNVSIISCLG